MIKKIKNIKNFGIFNNYTHNDLPNFKKYNLIYGWNASGKTTLSRLFRCFELKKGHESHPQGIFQLEVGENTVKNGDWDHIPNIRVFNKDFIEENIFKQKGHISPIYYLGEEGLKRKEELDMLKEEKEKKNESLKLKKESLEELKEKINKFSEEKSKNIKDTLRTEGSDIYTNYNKSNFTKDILKEKSLLREEDMVQKKKMISQTIKSEVQEIRKKETFKKEDFEKINIILNKKITSNIIENLKKNENLNSWVMQGMNLHRDMGKNSCLFCEQSMPSERFKNLEDHFNEEYNLLIKNIDETKIMWDLMKINQDDNFTVTLYDDLSDKFNQKISLLREEINNYNSFIGKVLQTLKDKRSAPFESLFLSDEIFNIGIMIEEVNLIIKDHNKRTDNFLDERLKQKTLIKNHLLSECYDEYKEIISEIPNIEFSIKSIKNKILNIEERINTMSNDITDYKKTAKFINEKLKDFLRREEFTLEPDQENIGYHIKTHYGGTKSLSEGEKTAIALIYFLTKLGEENFQLSDGIVVIDDPISSLDSNFVFQAFGLIRSEIKGAKQVFILTHNFDFFKHIKHWFKEYCRGKNDERWKSEFFMIENHYESERRNANLKCLDKLLKENDSEYQYLFKLLLSSQSESHEKIYLLPNVARKFLETFLSFKFPSEKNNDKKFSEVRELTQFNPEKIEKIKRFVNAHSHSDMNKMMGWDTSPWNEGKEVIKDVLDLVKKADKDHYDGLYKISNDVTN